MRSFTGWVLLTCVWLALSFSAYLACAAVTTPEGTCDPLSQPCDSVSGPGPGNGR